MVRWAAAAAYTQDIAFVTGGYGEEVSAGSWGVEVFRMVDVESCRVDRMGVSLNGGTPNLHPKMIIFSRKTHGCWVPPFLETPILVSPFQHSCSLCCLLYTDPDRSCL